LGKESLEAVVALPGSGRVPKPKLFFVKAEGSGPPKQPPAARAGEGGGRGFLKKEEAEGGAMEGMFSKELLEGGD